MLYNLDSPADDAELRAASIQFVRKLSGFTRPSRANEAAFEGAVDEITRIARTLLDSLVTSAPPRERAAMVARARARAAIRQQQPTNGKTTDAV